MAEELKLKVEADKRAIFVYDATGSYDKKCNPGGWGTPNLEPEDIEEVTIEVFPPESEEGITIDVIDALPNKDGLGFEILAEDLGLCEIKSGVWKFVYRLSSTVNEFDQQISVSKYFDEAIACCVDNITVNVDLNDISSDTNTKKLEMVMLLENARYAACVGDLYSAQKIANYISNKCNCCSNC